GIDTPGGPLVVSHLIFHVERQGRVAGESGVVPWIGHCSHLVALAERGGERFIALIPRDDLQLTAVETLARIPSARVVVAGFAPAALAPAPFAGELGLKPALAAARAVQMAGILDRLLALCGDYGNTRVHFGTPL